MSKLKKYKLSDLYSMSSGISSKPEQAGHGSPFLSFKTVFNNYFLPEALSDFMNTSERDKKTSSIEKGDIFLTRTSETLDELGMSAVALKDYPEASFSGFLKRLRPVQKEITYDKFMAFYLRSDYFRKIMTNNSIMTLRASLNEQIFSYLNLILPPLKIQQHIGDLLFSLNAKIEVNKRIIEELDAMAKTLFEYWFVQFDFLNELEKPYKTSGGVMQYDPKLKIEIPLNWKVKTLGEVTERIQSGGTPLTSKKEYYSGDINWYSTQELQDGFLVKSNKAITIDALDNSSAKLFPAGSILVAIYASPTVGRLGILSDEGAFNQACCGIVANEIINTEYIYSFLLSKRKLLNTLATGTTQKNLGVSTIKALTLVVPPPHIIAKFKNLAQPIFKQMLVCAKQNQELTALRKWLSPMLMNGQIDISFDYTASAEIHKHANSLHNFDRPEALVIPDNRKNFAKQVLGGKIVSVFKDDVNFTHIKFQKIQYLAEHISEADLGSDYYFQAAGPYDNKFMHSIQSCLKRSKWFEEINFKYIPLEKHTQIEKYYSEYFYPVAPKLNSLYELMSDATEATAEIIATLYAVWNNRIIKNEAVTDDLLIADFYNWSDRKHQYKREELEGGLETIRSNNIVPIGFGKELKRAKANQVKLKSK